MKSHTKKVSSAAFTAYAETHPEVWEAIIGCQVEHINWGTCTLADVDLEQEIFFLEGREARLDMRSFNIYYTTLVLPAEIALQVMKFSEEERHKRETEKWRQEATKVRRRHKARDQNLLYRIAQRWKRLHQQRAQQEKGKQQTSEALSARQTTPRHPGQQDDLSEGTTSHPNLLSDANEKIDEKASSSTAPLAQTTKQERKPEIEHIFIPHHPVYPVQVSPSTERQEIARICQQKGVKFLCHFTPLGNLESILRHGLWPRQDLAALKMPAIYTDQKRLDGYTNAVCLSVSFPNYKMFYVKRQRSSHEWVVLLLEASILQEMDCAFFPENAASNLAKYRARNSNRKTAQAFQEMFEDYQEGTKTIRRAELLIPDCYPTHPQAEVLVFGRIPPQKIRHVLFQDERMCKQWLTQHPEWRKKYHFNACWTYFGPRQDDPCWRNQPVLDDDDDLEEIPF